MIDNLTYTKQLLLEACLAKSAEVREKVVRLWDQKVVIDDIDFGTSRLLPYFFYLNQQDGIESIYDKRLKVIYKHWWLRTQHITHQLKTVKQALSDENIEMMIIKGASIKRHYKNDVLRPMADFDILIHQKDIHRAIDILQQIGYHPDRLSMAYLKKSTELFLTFNHAIPFSHSKFESQLDLHWQIGAHCSPEFTQTLWANIDREFYGGQMVIPRLAYEVFMLIVHAVQSQNRDNFNWILDIAVINEKYDLSFWEEVIAIAITEKKEEVLNYGCSILVQFGVEAPFKGVVQNPICRLDTSEEQRKNMNSIELFYARIKNTIHSINTQFSHSNTVDKVILLYKNIYYKTLIKDIRSKLN